MLGRISKLRHAAVGAAITGSGVLAWLGVIGGPPERFDAKTIVVEPRADGSIRITEFVDQDFGYRRRHGYERVVPNDLGAPVDVVASSPDAPADLSVVDEGLRTRIRIGDPAMTISGQHRYVLAYTYRDADLDELGLALDLVAASGDGWPGDQRTDRFEVVVVGVVLAEPRCDTGPRGVTGGCELVRDDADLASYRAVLEPLPADDGLSVYGRVTRFTDPAPVAAPALPDRRPDRRGVLALAMVPAGLAGAIPVYRWARRRGRNEVFAGGAADAAYGTLPGPGAAGSPEAGVELVADDELADLATTEFVPPKGLAPWHAAALLTERIGDDTVEAWFSGLAGREAITLTEQGDHLAIGSGPRRAELAVDDDRLLDGFLSMRDPYVTGAYDPAFASAWNAVAAHQREAISSSGWWKRLPPGTGFNPRSGGSAFGAIAIAVFLLVWLGAGVGALLGLVRSWPAALAFGVLLPGVIAFFVYRALLPVRSAQGSALALRAESFRRFLDASEGRHVEWAWSQGLLRECSAWAVALGEADAWSRALARANVPEPARVAAGPILIERMGPAVRTARTAPSRSGGGGGFSGGGSGGGGGGGSSGSW